MLAGTWMCDGTVRSAGSEEVSRHHEVWLQRLGSHVIEMEGCRVVADPVSAVLHNPGREYRTRSTPGALQASTVVWIQEAALLDVLDGTATPHDGGFPAPVALVGTEAALAHYRLRRLLREETASPVEVEEVTLRLIAGVVGAGSGAAPERRTRPCRAHRELVHAVQHLLADRYAERILLADIARGVGSSVFHLSRVFSRDVGVPLHRYLTRLRLSAALDRMADDERDLSRVGLEVGFSSHSHFTTAFRREFGRPPQAVRSTAGSERHRTGKPTS